MSGNGKETIYAAMYRLLSAWLHPDGAGDIGVEEFDFGALADKTDRHLLTAAVCFALERTGLAAKCPPEHMKRFQAAKLASIRKTLLMDAERKKLLSFLEESGIWYAPLKGIVLNGFYPQYGARQFSDNDILFDAERWREVRDYMERRGFQAKDVGSWAHYTYQKSNVYLFEMHHKLFADDFRGGFLSACAAHYANVRSMLVKDAENRFGYHFSDEDAYVYFLAHAFKHYSSEGTGLRTLLDIYLYRVNRKEMDEEHIARELDALGIREFEARCRTLSQKLFGFPPRLDALSEEEQTMLAWFESSGIFGTVKHRVEEELEAFQSDGDSDLGRLKRKYLWKFLFPDMRWYRTYAPLAYRHRWMIPFFWLRRLLRGIFVKGRKSLEKLRVTLNYSGSGHDGEVAK